MKTIIQTAHAPAPIGPYNQAIKHGNTLYVSGQIGLDPNSMEWVSNSITEETEQVMKNLEAVLKAAHMTFENVVKSTIFLSDMDNFTEVNAVYGSRFDETQAPARETVAVKTLPKNVRVETSMIAIA